MQLYGGRERESCVKPETASLCLYNVVALLQSKSPSNVSAHIRPQGITPTNKWKGEKSAAWLHVSMGLAIRVLNIAMWTRNVSICNCSKVQLIRPPSRVRLNLFYKRSTFVSSAWSFGFFIPATTANDLRLRKISIHVPDLIHYILFVS